MNPAILIATNAEAWSGFLSAQLAHPHALAAERLTGDEYRAVSDWFGHAAALLDEAGERIAAGRGYLAATVDILIGVVDVLGRIALSLVAIGPRGAG